jgi:hypothetical protein
MGLVERDHGTNVSTRHFGKKGTESKERKVRNGKKGTERKESKNEGPLITKRVTERSIFSKIV